MCQKRAGPWFSIIPKENWKGNLKPCGCFRKIFVDGLFLINFSYADDLRAAIDSCYPAPIVLCGMCNSPWARNEENTFDTVSIDVYKGIYDSTTHFIKKATSGSGI